MDSALLAVIGTLSGVVITAAVGLVGTILSGRNQRLSFALQLAAARSDQLRNERRAAYIEFLTAFGELRECVLTKHRANLRDGRTNTAAALKPADYAPAEAAQFIRVCHLLRVSCSDAISGQAQACADQLWYLGDNYYISSTEFDALYEQTRASRRSLEKAMRDDLAPAPSV